MIKEIKEGIKILVRIDGSQSLLLNSDHLDECIDYLYENDLRSITLNSFQGFKTKDISFLIKLKEFLEDLSILDIDCDYKVINELHRLKLLGIPDNGRDTIDLSNFPDLEMCGVEDTKRLKGLETCVNLKSVTISNYKSQNSDLQRFPLLGKLEHLSFIKTDIFTLKGIDRLQKLKFLEIFSASKLEKLAHLQGLSEKFEQLQVEKCKKITDYDSLGKIQSLKKIILSESGVINTLSFVRDLPNLEFFSFWGTEVLDGNLDFLEGVRYVGFDNRKHYSKKNEDFRK